MGVPPEPGSSSQLRHPVALLPWARMSQEYGTALQVPPFPVPSQSASEPLSSVSQIVPDPSPMPGFGPPLQFTWITSADSQAAVGNCWKVRMGVRKMVAHCLCPSCALSWSQPRGLLAPGRPSLIAMHQRSGREAPWDLVVLHLLGPLTLCLHLSPCPLPGRVTCASASSRGLSFPPQGSVQMVPSF